VGFNDGGVLPLAEQFSGVEEQRGDVFIEVNVGRILEGLINNIERHTGTSRINGEGFD
jgi:hypothetical protein